MFKLIKDVLVNLNEVYMIKPNTWTGVKKKIPSLDFYIKNQKLEAIMFDSTTERDRAISIMTKNLTEADYKLIIYYLDNFQQIIGSDHIIATNSINDMISKIIEILK